MYLFHLRWNIFRLQSFHFIHICMHIKTMLRFILNDATKRKIPSEVNAHETKWPNKIYFATDKVEVADGNVGLNFTNLWHILLEWSWNDAKYERTLRDERALQIVVIICSARRQEIFTFPFGKCSPRWTNWIINVYSCCVCIVDIHIQSILFTTRAQNEESLFINFVISSLVMPLRFANKNTSNMRSNCLREKVC